MAWAGLGAGPPAVIFLPAVVTAVAAAVGGGGYVQAVIMQAGYMLQLPHVEQQWRWHAVVLQAQALLHSSTAVVATHLRMGWPLQPCSRGLVWGRCQWWHVRLQHPEGSWASAAGAGGGQEGVGLAEQLI